MSNNGWTSAMERIAPFINRAEPDTVGALNVMASTVTDVRNDLRGELHDLRGDVQGVRSTLNKLLFSTVALLCSVIAGTIVLLVG